MLSGAAQPAGARRAAAGLSPVGSIGALLSVMCAIVACRAAFVKFFFGNIFFPSLKDRRSSHSAALEFLGFFSLLMCNVEDWVLSC